MTMSTAATTPAFSSPTRLSWEDIVVVVAYFILVVFVGLYASCRAKRNTVSGYFLAGRKMIFLTVGASLFVSNIGSEHFIGLSGSGAATGIGIGAWELNGLLLIQLLGFLFVPIYMACQTYTMPEYMSKRFGGQRLRVYFASLSLVLYIFTKISVNLYTGAIFIQQSLGWDLYLSIVLQIGIVAVLTVTGGLTAVIYTDTLQAVLMVIGALSLMAKGFYDIGGFNELWRRYPLAVTNFTVPNTTCHEINPSWNVMLKDPSDPDMPWPGFIFGQTPGSIWYWCADQVIVQRALAAKSLSHAQGSTLLAGFLKILPLFMMVMPGMMARVLYTDEVACVDPDICYQVCESRSGCSNIAYPRLVLGIMPTGARGLMMAVMLAALMSDLDSIFNSASTMFTIDIYQRIRSKARVKEIMIVGRLFVLVMVGISIAWVPVVKETQSGQIFIYIQEVSLYLSPPIACIFMLAVLWPRCNEKGAFWGLMAGFTVGATRLILMFVYPGPEECGKQDTRPALISGIQYMYFAVLLFVLTFIVAVIVSLLTDPPTHQQLYRTTFWTRYDKIDQMDFDKGNVRISWGLLFCYVTTSVHRNIDTQTYENEVEDENEVDTATSDEVTTDNRNDVDDTVKIHSNSEPISCQQIEMIDNESIQEGDGQNNQQQKSIGQSLKYLFFSFVCGVTENVDQNEVEYANALAAREEKICALEQDPVAKLVLHCLLFIFIAIGVFLLCFFSLWKYEVPTV